MQTVELRGTDDTLVVVSREELIILNNALNEVCNGLDVGEFSTRMGAEREEVKVLLSAIHKALDAQKVNGHLRET